MKKLVVASGNKNKIREIKALIGDKFDVVSMADEGINIEMKRTVQPSKKTRL